MRLRREHTVARQGEEQPAETSHKRANLCQHSFSSIFQRSNVSPPKAAHRFHLIPLAKGFSVGESHG